MTDPIARKPGRPTKAEAAARAAALAAAPPAEPKRPGRKAGTTFVPEGMLRRGRRALSEGFGTVHEIESEFLTTRAVRRVYHELCRKYNVARDDAPHLAKLAAMKARAGMKRNPTGSSHEPALPRSRKAAADERAALIKAIEGYEEEIARTLVIPLRLNKSSQSNYNLLVAHGDAKFIAAKTTDRLARYRSVLEAKGTQAAFDESKFLRGDQVIRFIETLKVPDGPRAGQKFILEDWQREAIRAIYDPSVVRDARTLMQIRQAIITMGRKNGKTSLAAAFVLVHLIGPMCGWNQQVISAAFDREQASVIFRAAHAMVAGDEELGEALTIHPSDKSIRVPMTLSTYKAISAEARSKHGLNPSLVVFDELGQFGSDRELFDVLQTSMGAQDESLMLVISTQAANDEAVMSQLIDYGRGDGMSDPAFCLVEYSTPVELDPWDEANWKRANPALGTFRSINEMRDFAARAKSIPSAERTFRNLYLNQRVAESGAFISPSVWDAGNAEVEDDALIDAPCWLGIDLSAKLDLTAAVFIWQLDEGRYAIRPWFFTPADTMEERGKRDRVPYYDWSKTGRIVALPGSAIDYRLMVECLAAEIEALPNLQAIVFDRWRFDIFKRELVDAGIALDAEKFIPFGQGFRDMSPAVDTLEELLLNRKLLHGGHPILRWNAGNCALEADAAGNRKFTKAKSYGRIDGIVALAMALAVASKGEAGDDDFSAFIDSPVVIGR